jgi:hypothetical protein
MNYQVIFDAAHPGIRSFWFPTCGFVMILVASKIIIFPNRSRKQTRTHGFFFLIFAIFWTFFSFAVTNQSYVRVSSALNDNRCSVVEGRVEHLHLGSVWGKIPESFDVGNCHFSYGENIVTGGFNRNMQLFHDPIYEGEQVRIHYLSSGNCGNIIARLEVAQ